jgi:hypothetical protein
MKCSPRHGLHTPIIAACAALLLSAHTAFCASTTVPAPIADFLSRQRPVANDRMQRVVLDTDGDGHPEIFLTLSSLEQAAGAFRWNVYLPASSHPQKDGYHRLPAEPQFDPRLSFAGMLDTLVPGGRGWIFARRMSPDRMDVVSAVIDPVRLTYTETPLRSLAPGEEADRPIFERFFGVTVPATIENFTLAEWAEMGDAYAVQTAPPETAPSEPVLDPPAPSVPERTAAAPLPNPLTAEPFARDLWVAIILGGLLLLVALGAVGLLFVPPRRS